MGKKPIIKTIMGCVDCPCCLTNDMGSGYTCKMQGFFKEPNQIDESKKYQPITPDWCPLKTQPILFKLANG